MARGQRRMHINQCRNLEDLFSIATLSYIGRQLLKIESSHSPAKQKQLSHKKGRRDQSTSLKSQVWQVEKALHHSI